MTPLEMHYSWVGFVYQATAWLSWLGQRLAEKWLDVVLALLIQKDMGFKEAVSIPNYEWQIQITGLSIGWTVEEAADLTIYNWDTGAAVYRHALMKETERTATSIRYSWMWDINDVPCGVYVGVVNFTIGGTPRIQNTASPVGKRLRIFLKLENGQIVKTHEEIPWGDKPADNQQPPAN